MATEKIQELADEYGIPTEVVEEYIEYMGFDADEVDELNYYGTFKNISDFAEQLVDEGVITDLGRYLYMTATDMHLLAGEEADNRIENMDDQEILDETDDNYTPDEVDEAREYLRDKYYDEIKEELEKDAVGYFVDQFGYSEEDLAKQSIFSVDYDKLGEDLEYDYNYITHDGDVYVFNNYKRGGMTYRGGGIVTDLNDAFASKKLKDLLNSRMKQGDPIVAFAYTDYGGDFFDKVAIEYFKEHHPENIVVERTAYNGQNAIVFGEPASEFLEAYESYLLGYENMEDYYYQMEYEQTEDDFEFFLRDLSNYGEYKVSERTMDWLMENKSGGYYSMTTQGLDFSSSDLERELLEEGLIKKEDDDDDEEFTDEENYAKGGNVPTIEKRVAEVNALIKEGNEKGVEVVDTSSTWQSPMKYKPFKYSNGVLYEEYEELNLYSYNRGEGTKWETKKYKFTKSGSFGLDDQKGVLNQVARMYRKAINSFNKYGYNDGGMMARGGETEDNYKEFDFGEDGNLTANINGDVYTIIYRDDTSQLYDLFKNGKKINSSLRVRDLTIFADGGYMADGGMTTTPDSKIKNFLLEKLIDDNINFRDENYPYSKDEKLTQIAKKYGYKKHENFAKSLGWIMYYDLQKDFFGKYGYGTYKSGAKDFMAKGGFFEHGLEVGDKIISHKVKDDSIIVQNEFRHERARVDLEKGKRSLIERDRLKYNKGGVTFDDKVESISKSLVKRKKVSPSVQKDYGKTYSKKEAIESAKRIAGAMRKKELSKKK